MALYWTFELEAIAARVLYPRAIEETQSTREIMRLIEQFRYDNPHQPFESLPM